MNKYRIAICDDSIEHIDIISGMTKMIIKSANINCSLYTYTSGKELVYDHERIHFDIVILDMEMPELNGIETGFNIKDITKNTKIIYVTAHEGYAYDSYKVKAEDYILKPVQYSELETALTSCIGSEIKKERKFLDINDISRNFQRIYIDNIIYMQREKDRKIYIYCIYKKIITINDTIQNLEKKLADNNNIIKANQGCLINLNNVRKITKDIITFCDDSTVKISESRLSYVKKEFYKSL